jgi:3-deoxy-manno-octulosonate cytidylyltransferase (CMP-KDO synthetase)
MFIARPLLCKNTHLTHITGTVNLGLAIPALPPSMKSIIGIIPARYASTRFPGKPLADIRGKSMIQRVYEQSKKSSSLADVIVATDDPRIEKAVVEFGGTVCMTSPHHPSGTDRCAEVVKKMKLSCDAVINIQGDEPFIEPGQIDLVSACFMDDRTQLATLIKKITTSETLFNINSPKVIIDREQFAIYFSRHPIPFLRGVATTEWLKHQVYYQHIGIYGYRKDVLEKVTTLAPSSLEKAESLEQLRWIENGFKIKTATTTHETLAVDTPEDLRRIVNSLTL